MTHHCHYFLTEWPTVLTTECSSDPQFSLLIDPRFSLLSNLLTYNQFSLIIKRLTISSHYWVTEWPTVLTADWSTVSQLSNRVTYNYRYRVTKLLTVLTTEWPCDPALITEKLSDLQLYTEYWSDPQFSPLSNRVAHSSHYWVTKLLTVLKSKQPSDPQFSTLSDQQFSLLSNWVTYKSHYWVTEWPTVLTTEWSSYSQFSKVSNQVPNTFHQ